MNKLFQKVAALTLGFAMIGGACLAVSLEHNQANNTYAAVGDNAGDSPKGAPGNWVAVTSTSDIVAGEPYLIGYQGSSSRYYGIGSVSSKSFNITTTDFTEAKVIQFVTATGGFNIKISSTKCLSNSDKGDMSETTSSHSVWTVNEDDDGNIYLANSSNSDRFLARAAATDGAKVKTYAASNYGTYELPVIYKYQTGVADAISPKEESFDVDLGKSIALSNCVDESGASETSYSIDSESYGSVSNGVFTATNLGGPTTVTATKGTASCTFELQVVLPDTKITVNRNNFTEITGGYTAVSHNYNLLNDLSGGVSESTTIALSSGKYLANVIQLEAGGNVKNTTAVPGRIKTITIKMQSAVTLSMKASLDSVASSSSTSIAADDSSAATQVFDFTSDVYNYFYFGYSVLVNLESMVIEYEALGPEITLTSASLEVASGGKTASTTFSYINFTASGVPTISATVKTGSALTYSAISQNGTTITVTSSSNTGVVVFTITGTLGSQHATAELTVEVVAGVRNLTNLQITTSTTDVEFNQGSSLTASDLVVRATFDAYPLTVDFSGMTSSDSKGLTFLPALGSQLNTVGENTIRVSYTFTGPQDNAQTITKYVEYTVTVVEVPTFTKVSSTDGLVLGDTYILGYESESAVASTSISSGAFGKLAATYTSGQIDSEDLPDGALLFTILSDGNGKYYLVRLAENNYKPINVSSTNFSYNSTETLTGASAWPISISSGSATIGTAGTNRVLYNVNSPRFKPYTSNPTSSMVLPNLFKMSGSYVKTRVISFANNYLKMNDHNYDGDITTENCEANYLAMKSAYTALTDFEKNLFNYSNDFENARARLNNWAAANGETFTYGSNTPFSSSRVSSFATIDNSRTITIITVISLVSVGAIGGYFFIHRRKEI